MKRIFWQMALAVLQTLTGVSLAIFLLMHLFEISLIGFGIKWPNFYTIYASHPNPLIEIIIVFLAAAAILHGLNGLKIVWQYFKKIPEVNGFLADTKYRDSFFWYIHFSTGILILIFMVLHLASKHFGIQTNLQNNYYFTSMILLLTAVIFHICYGLRTVCLKYGISTKHLRKIEIILVVIGIALAVIGIINLLALRG